MNMLVSDASQPIGYCCDRWTYLCHIRRIPIERFRQIIERILFVYDEQVLLAQRMGQIDDLQ